MPSGKAVLLLGYYAPNASVTWESSFEFDNATRDIWKVIERQKNSYAQQLYAKRQGVLFIMAIYDT